MNALTIAPRSAFLVLPPTLKLAVRASMPASYVAPGDENPHVVTAPYVPNQTAVDEAKATLGAAEASLRPIERVQFRKWLLELSAGVANPPSGEKDFELRCTSLSIAISDLPAACFTDNTLKQAMRQFKFFPSAAELFAFAEAIARPMRAEVEAIRRIAGYSFDGRPSGQMDPTDADRAEVAEKLRRLKAELAAHKTFGGIDEFLRPKPMPLSDRQLLETHAILAAQGNRLSQARVDFLRQKLGIEEMAHAE
jgi:hypothetical protein